MTNSQPTIDSLDAFRDRLTDLFAAAERGDVDLRGAFAIKTSPSASHYDVLVTRVVPKKHPGE